MSDIHLPLTPRNETAYLSALVRDQSSQPLRPPLPATVRRVLSRCRFAYLSTADVDSLSSHLSLMRFTYLPDEETIVLSTNRKTKKYDMLERGNTGVALLIHDFAEDRGAAANLTGEYSITLNGKCSVVKDGETYDRTRISIHARLTVSEALAVANFARSVVLAEKYRAAHLKNNPDYPQVRSCRHSCSFFASK